MFERICYKKIITIKINKRYENKIKRVDLDKMM